MGNFLKSLFTSLRSLKAPKWLAQDDPYESLGPSVTYLDSQPPAMTESQRYANALVRQKSVASAARLPQPIFPPLELTPAPAVAKSGATVVSMEEWLASKLSAGSIK